MRSRAPCLVTFAAAILLGLCGCEHEPLPRLKYPTPPALGTAKPVIPTAVSFEAGAAYGHTLTSYALMPGGWALPINSPSSGSADFNTADQAAFVENLGRVLTERGVIELTTADAKPVATLTVKFMKTEYFPNMQDYILDALVTLRRDGKTYQQIHHVSTIDGVNLAARMFQNALDGRRRAAEMLLAAIVPDVEKWLLGGETVGSATISVDRPFAQCSKEIIAFLATRYERPSTFWKDGIDVSVVWPSADAAVVEMRWARGDGVPPFCTVDIVGNATTTHVTVKERDRLLVAKAGVPAALESFLKPSGNGKPGNQP